MTGLVRLVDPAATPLTLDEVKKHLRVSSTDKDDLITMYLQGATDYLDGEWGFLGRALITQTWRLTLDTFPSNGQIRIPLPPLQSVTSVKYDDTAGNEQVVDPSTYFVDTDSEPGWIVTDLGSSWPSTLNGVNTVRIEFVAGYSSDTSKIPDNIRAGMLLIIASWMENAEGIVDTRMNTLPLSAEMLVRRHKIDRSMA